VNVAFRGNVVQSLSRGYDEYMDLCNKGEYDLTERCDRDAMIAEKLKQTGVLGFTRFHKKTKQAGSRGSKKSKRAKTTAH
jgi:hypothetical protein